MKRRGFLKGSILASLLFGFSPLTESVEIQTSKQDDKNYIRSIYGFNSRSEPFKNIEKEKLPTWLKEHSINAVFVSSSEDEDVLKILKEHEILCFEEITIFASRALYQEHPEWRPITADGIEMKPDGWYYPLNPNHPTLREKRLEDFAKKLQNRYLDGVWLDFIRFPVRWENSQPRIEQASFDPYSLEQFEIYIGKKLPKSDSVKENASYILKNYLEQWTHFKIDSIRSWVEEAKVLMQKQRPDMRLGLFGVPWLEEDYDDAIRAIVAQDFEVLAPFVDVFSPMVYHRLTGRDVAWIGKVTESVKNQTNKPVWPIVQATSESDKYSTYPTKTMTSDEFQSAIREGAKASEGGIIIYTSRHIEEEKRWDEVKKTYQGLE